MRPMVGGLLVVVVLTAAAICLAPAQEHVARTEPRTPAEEQKSFRLPPGFDIQLVAAEPDIRKPINLAFDALGRLWVTDTVEYPFPAPADRKPRDSVKVLEDTDGDGKADRVTTFADGLNIPIGVLPLGPFPPREGRPRMEAIVHSIPNVWKLADTDGDGIADRRDVLLSGFGHQDTHGMTGSFTWGFDGWVYAHHGFSNTSTIQGADGSTLRLQSGNTYRFRPESGQVEPFTWGQVNPFGLCLDPLGNLYSTDCHSRPAYLLLRGAYYPSFGKPHDGLGFGPELLTHSHNSTALCGITYYAADQFPREYHGSLFIGNVWTCRINHDRLDWRGSSPKGTALPDFLTSDDPWFRPVDIQLGPDGALYVADFYNRIIGHYEVPLNHPGRDRERGRIWRISYRGPDARRPAGRPRADWSRAALAELVQDLDHPNLTVRLLATHQLVERGPGAVPAVRGLLRPEASPRQRLHALWVLHRPGQLDEPLLAAAAQDLDPAVRVHAQRVLAEHSKWSPRQRSLALAGLNDADPNVQRAAADALARHPDAEQVRPLLDRLPLVAPDDTHLRHVARMALRDQLRSPQTWKLLSTRSWSERDWRTVADVLPGLSSVESASLLVDYLARFPESGERLHRFVQHAARFGDEATDARLFRLARQGELRQQAAAFKAIQQGLQARGAKLPAAAHDWAEQLAGQLLAATDNDLVLAGADLAGTLRLKSQQASLARLAGDAAAPQPQRESAVNALVAIDPAGQAALLGRFLADAGQPLLFRDRVAQALGRVNLAAARDELLRALPTAPAGLQATIAAGLAGSPEGAEQLLAAVAAGKASARLLQDKVVLVRLGQSKLPRLNERLAELTRGLPPADQRLNDLLQRRRTAFARASADPTQGARVFEKHCAACHQLANKGARIGPQLDGVGLRGLDRLLEDLLDPNRNVDQAFRATSLGLKNGQVVIGLLLREEGEVLVLADGQGKELRIAKKEVEEQAIAPLSPMPANVAEQVPEEDFSHLLAFLLAQRQPPDKK